MKSLGSSLSTAGKTMSTFVTLPMAGLGAGMVKLAADAGESASKMEAVFGKSTGGMNKWIGELRKTVPATTTELQGMSSSIQDLLVPLGMAPKEAQGLTKEVVTLAGDLASFNNIPMDEALEKIRSGMVGQYEPLLDFGVALSADTVKAEAMRMGLIKEGQELDANSRAQAALSLTMKGTTAAHGDAAKTAGSAANSFKFLWSQVKELGATMGQNLLPIITPVVQKMAALAGRVGELSPKWQAVILGVGAFVAALGPLLLIVGTVVSALGSLMLATGAAGLGAAFGLAAAAVGSFLVAAAPFIAVAAAMAGAGLLLYRNWGKVKTVFAPVTSAIKGLRNAIAGLATGDIPRFLQGSRATPAALQPIIAIAAKVIGQLRMLGRSFRALGGMILGWSKSSASAWANLTPAWRAVVLAIHSGAQRIKSGLGTAFKFLIRQGQQLVAWFKQNWPQIKTTTLTVVKAVARALKTGLGTAFKFIVTQGQRLITWTRENWPQIKTTVLAVVRAVGSAIRTVLGGAFKFALQNGKILVNWFKQNWPLIQRTVVTVMKIIASRVRTGFNLLKSIISTVVKAIVSLWKNNWTEIKRILESVWRIIKSVVQTAIKNVLNILKLGMQVITGDWRGAWRTVKTILSDNWENIKTIVRQALRILGEIIKIAWNNLKAITKAAFNAVRDFIEEKLQTAKERAVEILKNLGQAAFDRYEAMKRSAKAAFEAIKGFMVSPIESAYNGIKDWVEKILGVVNSVLKAVGLDEIKLEGGTESPGGNGSSGRGSRPAMVARFARGGMAREHRMGRFAKGGLGTSSPQPRTHMWNEQMGNEAYIAEKRPAKEQLPYLQTAADWHGYAVVPSTPSLMKNFKHDDTTFARGGLAGVPMVPFAIGGETTASGQAMHSAVKEKFGVDGFNRHGSYLSQPGASRSIDWMVTTPGNRAEGSQKTLGDNIASFVSPPSTRATIWYGQANYGGGWQGYSTGPGMGNSNTLGHYDHVHGEALADSFKGAQGTAPTGGGGGTSSGFNPLRALFDKLWDAGVQPLADKFLKPLKDSNYVMTQAAGAMAQKIPDGIKEWALSQPVLSGGDGGGPVSGNFSGSQKQVALEFAKNAVGRGMPGRLPVMTALQESGMKNLDYGDRDSLGYFQQRPSQGWGTEAQIRDPAHALGAFLDAANPFKGQYSNSATGLSGWAQAVQRSAYPDAYAKHWGAAGSLIGDPKYYSEGGMTNGPQNAVIGEAGPELVLPLSSARVMQSAQTALGVSQLHEEVRGMREDMKNLRVNVGDIETPAAGKLIVTQEHTAKRILNGRDGLNATKKHQSSINKVLDLSGGR